MVTERINVSPKKRSLRIQSEASTESKCISELLDNCIDEWKLREGEVKQLNIDIKVERKGDGGKKIRPICRFSMKWNMSIPKEKLIKLLTPGETDDEHKSIGLWGMGAKIAMHGIARSWRLYSKDEEKSQEVVCPESWIMDEDDWDLNLNTNDLAKNEVPNETIFESIKLADNKWVELKPQGNKEDEPPRDLNKEIIDYIKQTYCQFGERITITYNNEPIELIDLTDSKYIRAHYLLIPGFEPSLVEKWVQFAGRNVTLKAFVGLHKLASTEEAGVYLFGNGRRFNKALKEGPIFSKYHSEWTRIRIFVFIEGNSEDIPWGIPKKDGLNETHWLIDFISQFVNEVAAPYSDIVKMPRDDLNIYSIGAMTKNQIAGAGYDEETVEKMALLIDEEKNYYKKYWAISNMGQALCHYDNNFKKTIGRAIDARSNSLNIHMALAINVFKDDENITRMAMNLAPEEPIDNPPVQKASKKPTRSAEALKPVKINYPGYIAYINGRGGKIKMKNYRLVTSDGKKEFSLQELPVGFEYRMDKKDDSLYIVKGDQTVNVRIADLSNIDQRDLMEEKNYSKADLELFNQHLDSLSTTLKIKDKSLLMKKMINAMKLMEKEINKKGYPNARTKMVKELLGLK